MAPSVKGRQPVFAESILILMPPPDFRCAIVGHNQEFVILSPTLDADGLVPGLQWSQTLRELAAKLEAYHAYYCDCGFDLDLADNIWPANLTWDVELDLVLEQYRPRDAQRLQPDTQITDLDVPPGGMPPNSIFLGHDNGTIGLVILLGFPVSRRRDSKSTVPRHPEAARRRLSRVVQRRCMFPHHFVARNSFYCWESP